MDGNIARIRAYNGVYDLIDEIKEQLEDMDTQHPTEINTQQLEELQIRLQDIYNQFKIKECLTALELIELQQKRLKNFA